MNQNFNVDYLCSAPFWKFTNTGENEYCKICKHHIHDLTAFDTDKAIKLLKEQGGEVCGTFYKDQFVPGSKTKYGPNIFKLLLAGTLSAYAVTRVSAQSPSWDTIKVQQYDTNTKDELLNGEVSKSKIDSTKTGCVTYPLVEEETNTKIKKRKDLFRIGRTRFSCSWRFPFLHVYSVRRGKISYSKKSF